MSAVEILSGATPLALALSALFFALRSKLALAVAKTSLELLRTAWHVRELRKAGASPKEIRRFLVQSADAPAREE